MTDKEDDIPKGNALIRHYFNENPDELSAKEWSRLVAEAIWLKHYEMKRLAELVTALFGNK